jgi:hypothetical protein
MTAPPAGSPNRHIAVDVAAPLLLSGTAMLLCCLTLDATLGLAFAGFAIASLLSPPLAVPELGLAINARRRLLSQVTIAVPILIGWLWVTFAGGWSLGATALLAALLSSYIAMLSTTAVVVASVTSATVGRGMTSIAAVAWLAWPIWTVDWMTPSLANRLVNVHPLFAANRVTGFAPWPEHGMMYHLTRLGQDLPYALPTSVWPAVTLNVAVGLIGLAIVRLARARAAMPHSSS